MLKFLPNDYICIYEYEQYLAGATDRLSKNVFSTDDDVIFTKEHNAIVIMQFACLHYLGWDAETTRTHFNEDIIKKLKLKEAYNHLTFPHGLSKKKDYWYVSYLLYPDYYNVSEDNFAIFVYKNILSRPDGRIPKGFTDGEDGKKRACKCLNYVLNNLYTVVEIDDLYDIFSNKKSCQEFLDKYKLSIMSKKTFQAPIDMLFSSLNEEQRDYELYHYDRFRYFFGEPKLRL